MSLMFYYYKNNRDYRAFDAKWLRRVASRLDVPVTPRVVHGSGLFMEFVCPDNIYTAEADNTIYFSDADIAKELYDKKYTDLRYQDGIRYSLQEDENKVRLTNDLIGSVNLWYFANTDGFIISSSMRLLVMIASFYQPDREAFSWFLCNGQLCPGKSWCDGINLLPGGGQELQFSFATKQIQIIPRNETHGQGQRNDMTLEEMGRILPDAISRVKVTSGMRLSLSGGVDSRVILYEFIRHGIKMPCVVTGAPEFIHDSNCDVGIARDIASHLGVDLLTLKIPETISTGDIDQVYDHFCKYIMRVEGCGFTPPFSVDTHELEREAGITDLLRGNEAFGWSFVANEIHARQMVAINLFSDYSESKPLYNRLSGLMPHTLTPELQRMPEESLATWCDRLYRVYRIPCCLNPLISGLANKMNTLSPFWYNSVIQGVLRTSDRNRVEKYLFRKYCEKIELEVAGRNFPIAVGKPFPPTDGSRKHDVLMKVAMNILSRSKSAAAMFDPDLVMDIQKVSQQRPTHPEPSNIPRKYQQPNVLKRYIPKSVKYYLKRLLGMQPSRDVNLTFQYGWILIRMAVISMMADVLADDARYIHRQE